MENVLIRSFPILSAIMLPRASYAAAASQDAVKLGIVPTGRIA